MPVCFGYSKPNLCSMRAEALHGTRGWESAVSPGELAEVDNVSFITIAKSEGNAVVNYALATRCAPYALKKLPRSVFYIFTITITLSFCCNTCHAPYKQLPAPTPTLIFTLKIISHFLKQLKTL